MTTATSWLEENQRHLMQALAGVQRALERHAGLMPGNEDVNTATIEEDDNTALDILCRTFGLSPFERHMLLLCAGVELSSEFAAVCAAVQHNVHACPTFSLALAALPGAHWSAVTPDAPLRYWHLIELGPGDGLVNRPLFINESILHFLTGLHQLDERLAALLAPLSPSDSHSEERGWGGLVERITRAWEPASGILPVIQLCGGDPAARRALAIAACESVQRCLYALSAAAIPVDVRERERFLRLCEREAVLGHAVLLLECDDMNAADTPHEAVIRQVAERLNTALIISGEGRRSVPHRPLVTLEVPPTTAAEQYGAWRRALGRRGSDVAEVVDGLTTQFALSPVVIQQIGAEALEEVITDATALGDVLWQACRAHARPRLDDLAQRIETSAEWEDLVLPEAQQRLLREIVMQVRHRATVYHRWGFAARSRRGLGISALFSGASGTGKTLAAEVLANALQLDLYRIDLSQVVNKYIGETEKNLKRVFDAAEMGGVVLLFDEAEALFGKRSEVKDSHDRYANIEVGYLLQRMEVYRGLAILTTNMKETLDTAFLRRLRFVVQFPFPDATLREQIWRRVLPSELPTDGVAVERLASLNVTGGSIRNIALHAAFLAAHEDTPVGMSHLLRAAQVECAKQEKPLAAGEVAGWR